MNGDDMEGRLRRSLTAVADGTRATNRWADVTARIADPGAARELDYVTVVAPRRRRPSRPLAAIVAFVAVVAGAFGVASLGGGDGSGTPEKAVEKVFAAIADEDPIGVLQAVAPSERKVLVPLLEQLSSKLEQLHVASGDLDLDRLGGVRFDVSDLRLATTQLSDDYALVRVLDARLRAGVHLSDLPFADALRGAVLPGTQDPDPFAGQVSDLKLVTVKEDGGWYVGIQASLARLADAAPGSPGPDFAGGFPERGADSPEAAAREMIDAIYARDIRREIELTPISESAALHVWGPSLELAGRRSDDGRSPVQLQSLTLRVEDGDDGAKVVRPTAYRLTVDDDDGQEIVDVYDGRCVTQTFPRSTDSVDAGPHRTCGPFTSEPVTSALATFYATPRLGAAARPRRGRARREVVRERREDACDVPARRRGPPLHRRGHPGRPVDVLRGGVGRCSDRAVGGVRREPTSGRRPACGGRVGLRPLHRPPARRLHRPLRVVEPIAPLRLRRPVQRGQLRSRKRGQRDDRGRGDGVDHGPRFGHDRPHHHERPLTRTLAGVTDEAAELEGFLDWYRDVAIQKLADLSTAEAQRVSTPTHLTLLGIVKHLSWAEWIWFEHFLHGTPRPAKENAESFEVTPADTLEQVLADYRDACARSRARVAAAPSLDQLAAVEHRVWGIVTLRWILVHMIEETARHAGHMDILRELTDGRTGP